MNAIVKAVSIWSAFKIGCVFQFLLSLLVLLLLFFLSSLAMLGMSSMLSSTDQVYGVVGTQFLLILILLPLSAIAGGISWGILAFMLNLAISLAGGLEIKLSRKQVTSADTQEVTGYKPKFDEPA